MDRRHFLSTLAPLAAAPVFALQTAKRPGRLRITDIRPAPDAIRQQFGEHDFRQGDVTDFTQVHEAASGVDAIINLSVVRQDPVLAFRVNTLGCYLVMRTAVERSIRRVINTGPHFTVAGRPMSADEFPGSQIDRLCRRVPAQ